MNIIIHKPGADVRAVWNTAANIIKINGLAIDSMVDYVAAETLPSPRQAPVCAIGAIRIAYGHDPDDPDANGRRCPALAAFAERLIRTQQATCDHEPGDELDPDDVITIIATWSDRLADNGGANAVINELRQAATEVS